MHNVFITDEDGGVKNISFTYLLGFQPSLWAMILSENTLIILLDGRYFDNKENIDTNLVYKRLWKQVNIKFILLKWDIVESIILSLWSNSTQINIENSLTYSYVEKFQKLSNHINIIEPYFTQQRIIKQEDEIQNIKKAIKIISQVYREIEKLNKAWEIIWKTEIEIRQFIISKIFEFGWSGESFEAIVAHGPNSAIPHHRAWNTIVTQWVLLIDMWAIYKWYCSDFTRTFWIGERSTKQYKKFQEIHSIVQKAHDSAIAWIKIWNTTSSVDKIARDYISSKWYAELFIHSTGHWVWLDIHEIPGVSPKSENIIQKNMVFTVEPWIYISWEFWIRIEDIIIV